MERYAKVKAPTSSVDKLLDEFIAEWALEAEVEESTIQCVLSPPTLNVSPHKTFRIKQFLVKKQKQNHPIPQQIRMKTGNKIRYNSKRRPWKRTRLGL
ncbi:putative 60S ribosomal protein L39-like 5 [Octodon degus]|uniref:Large ribosomal subunit protein eL39 n=1 Tax=Octodon degus TaxID=10160 RepID=A0A6P3VCS1_OCTDE|nr:putative 60S ribosomal protein L39-like 5 [Octodon degus]